MRVLMVNNYAHVTGGADLHCLEITEGLREAGHDVAWVATDSPQNVETRGAFVRRRVGTETRADLSPLAQLDVARRALWNRDAFGATTRMLDEFRPDVVHVHKAYVQLSVAPVVAASSRGVPVVQTVHDYEFLSASPIDATGGAWDGDESKFAYRALNSATFLSRAKLHVPRVDRWIAVSRAVRDRYREVGGIECEVLPNFCAPAGETTRPREDREGVIYLGRLSTEKGVHDVLAAASALPGIRFTIAGDGPLRIEVERAASSMDNVRFVGFVGKDAARHLLAGSVACLMPSTWAEPGPLTCLESMSEGTPVISYPSGGLAEYVGDSGAGIVCGKAQASDLVAAIARVTTEPALWAELSSGGVNGISERHTRGTYLAALENVYDEARSDSESRK